KDDEEEGRPEEKGSQKDDEEEGRPEEKGSQKDDKEESCKEAGQEKGREKDDEEEGRPEEEGSQKDDEEESRKEAVTSGSTILLPCGGGSRNGRRQLRRPFCFGVPDMRTPAVAESCRGLNPVAEASASHSTPMPIRQAR
ncbi:MAG: hypothetical protein ABI777_00785, partial [Betaproteobacteria bacterium]